MATATASTKGKSTKATKATPAKPHVGIEPVGIGVKDLAEHLGTDGRTLRKFLRGQIQISVGFGGRYLWPSLTDPQVKKIVAAWNEAHAAE